MDLWVDELERSSCLMTTYAFVSNLFIPQQGLIFLPFHGDIALEYTTFTTFIFAILFNIDYAVSMKQRLRLI
jgi:hypothetical protein